LSQTSWYDGVDLHLKLGITVIIGEEVPECLSIVVSLLHSRVGESSTQGAVARTSHFTLGTITEVEVAIDVLVALISKFVLKVSVVDVVASSWVLDL
jgi:hypothetical protein